MDQISREEARAAATKGFADPVWFCRFFLSHLFPGDIPWVHRGLLAILSGKVAFLAKYGEVDKIIEEFIWEHQGKRHQIFSMTDDGKIQMTLRKHTLILMPRGSGKTTIAGIAMPIYRILYEEIPFSFYVSETANHTKMQLHNIQRELSDNSRILAVFGDRRPLKSDDEKWTQDFFETNTGIAIGAKGRGGQVRGVLHRGNRPNLLIGDDLEDRESVSTEEQRIKTIEWFYGDFTPALPELDPNARIIVLATMLNEHCLPTTLMADPEWTCVRFGVRDSKGLPLWAAYMDEEKIEAKKLSYASVGMLHVYYLEYENLAVSPDAQPFKSRYFRYDPNSSDVMQASVYIDPAISEKRTADKTAIVVAGMTKAGIIKVLDVVAERGMSERDKIDHFFRLQKTYKTSKQGIESVGYQAALVHTMRSEMFRKKQYFEIIPVNNKDKKSLRIKGIVLSRLISGYLIFTKRFVDLETEALDWREGKKEQKDDLLDALAGAIILLDPYAAYSSGDLSELAEDKYEPLEKAIGGICGYSIDNESSRGGRLY